MIFPSKNLAKFFDRLYLESGNDRLVIFLIVPDLYYVAEALFNVQYDNFIYIKLPKITIYVPT